MHDVREIGDTIQLDAGQKHCRPDQGGRITQVELGGAISGQESGRSPDPS
jgi:hypothetical protein